MKNAAKRVFSCKDRRRYSRKRATFSRKFAKNWYSALNWALLRACLGAWSRRPRRRRTIFLRPSRRVRGAGLGFAKLAKLGKLAKFCKFLAGSFSAVSKRNFARKYAFDSIFRALQDLHTSAALQSQFFSKKIG